MVGSERETQMGSALLALLRHACSIARGLAPVVCSVLVDQAQFARSQNRLILPAVRAVPIMIFTKLSTLGIVASKSG